MGNKTSSSTNKREKNADRRNGKASKKNPGVAPGAHNGHSIGGYSVKKYGKEFAAELAENHTRSMTERREKRQQRKQAAKQTAKPIRGTHPRSDAAR